MDIIINYVFEAMEKGELKPFFQPQVDSRTEQVIAVEALVRWVKPDGTVIPPEFFVPILEKSQAINSIDWYVIKEVCIFLHDHKEEMKGISMSVNFSRWHIRENDCAKRLRKLVDYYEIDPNQIEIEIHELAFAKDKDRIGPWIESLRKVGFRIAVDNLGSGLSSMATMKEVPVDVMKLDRSLLAGNCLDVKERAVIESLFYFAHRLGIITVTEGVETEQQLAFLRTCGSNRVQGFLFSRPLRAEDFLAYLKKTKEEADQEDIEHNIAFTDMQAMIMQAVNQIFPVIIASDLNRNSYAVMNDRGYSSVSDHSVGDYDRLIIETAESMVEKDRELFRKTFLKSHLSNLYERGERVVKLDTTQMDKDGGSRKVRSTVYLEKGKYSSDLMAITLLAFPEDEEGGSDDIDKA